MEVVGVAFLREQLQNRLPHPKIMLFLTSVYHLIDRFQEKEASSDGVFCIQKQAFK
jgi:hypothetical protein